MEGWRYYNHALLPTCAPHETPDLDRLNERNVWNAEGKALLARWVTDWDCGSETDWWYVILDKPFDISDLKSKRRYEIRKGLKNYNVEIVDPLQYEETLFDIAKKAFSVYPEKYRPTLNKTEFIKDIRDNWVNYTVFLARNTEGIPSGYAYLDEKPNYADFSVLKTVPEEERNGVNAAIVYTIVEHYSDQLGTGHYYICDGSRAIFHETHFQDYLMKYFSFRKAYCRLRIRYRKGMGSFVKAARLTRPIINDSSIGIFNRIESVLVMDEIANK